MEKDGSEARVESRDSSTYTFEEEMKHSFSLDSTVSIKSFDTCATATYSNSPSLILLFSWTGAQPRYVSKYVEGYAKLFPSSPALVVPTSLKDLAIRSSADKQKMLQPTLDIVLNSGFSYSNILVHCFSDGGSNKAVEFAEAYHSRTGEKLPCHAFCLDSTPGHPRVILAILWFSYYVFIGFEHNVITETRRRLEDERYWSPKITPRVYLFSEADDIIYWKDIERHGVEAARNGVPITLVRFRDSGHCCHVKENESEYWKVVREIWEMRDLEIGVAL
jgi:hypothetical protein